MNAITRWDPLQEFQLWSDRMNRVFQTEPLARTEREEGLTAARWAPPVDILEGKDKITLTVELPGFTEKDVDLTVEDGLLTLKGERHFRKETTEENYHRIERSYGSFVRSFSLPTNVEQGSIHASFHDGLLSIDLPKREEAKPKQIKITGSATPDKDVDVRKTK